MPSSWAFARPSASETLRDAEVLCSGSCVAVNCQAIRYLRSLQQLDLAVDDRKADLALKQGV